MIGAIETEYRGYKFRSRLEARWAVFFDELGIEYLYEHEGYEVNGVRYLPDFYLPKFGTHVEVKGDPQAMIKDWDDKWVPILDHASPLPGMFDSVLAWEPYPRRSCYPGLIFLGEVPEVTHGHVLHPIVRHHKGLIVDWIEFTIAFDSTLKLDLKSADELWWVREITGDRTLFSCQLSPSEVRSVVVPTKLAFSNICKAYQAARQARFEFGAVHA